MPFQNIAVRQSRVYELDNQTGSIVVTPSSAFAAGSTVVVIGAAFQAGTGQAVLLSSVSGGGTWQSPSNVRASSDYAPNVFAAVLYNVSASTPSITLTMNQSSSVRASLSLIEVNNVPTSAVLDGGARTGTASSGTTTSAAATGTLSQTDNLILLCAGGWFGAPQTPGGYTAIQTTANGSGPGYVGCGVYWQKVTATTSITGTVAHDTTAGSSAMALVLKAADVTARTYRFTLNSTLFNNTKTGLTCYVWRNGGPDSVVAELYTGLSGSATAGQLNITPSPTNVQLTDTISGIVYSSTETSGLITGTVV